MIGRTSKNQDRHQSSPKTYEFARQNIANIMSEKWKQDNPNNYRSNKGENNPMYGTSRIGIENPFFNKKHSEESKHRISIANKGRTGKHNIRKVIIDTDEYCSLTEAAKCLNTTVHGIYHKINSKNYSNYNYKENESIIPKQ